MLLFFRWFRSIVCANRKFNKSANYSRHCLIRIMPTIKFPLAFIQSKFFYVENSVFCIIPNCKPYFMSLQRSVNTERRSRKTHILSRNCAYSIVLMAVFEFISALSHNIIHRKMGQKEHFFLQQKFSVRWRSVALHYLHMITIL